MGARVKVRVRVRVYLTKGSCSTGEVDRVGERGRGMGDGMGERGWVRPGWVIVWVREEGDE